MNHDVMKGLITVSQPMIRASNEWAKRDAIHLNADGTSLAIHPEFSHLPFQARFGFTAHINGIHLGLETEALPFRPALEKKLGTLSFDHLDRRLQTALIEDFAAYLLDELQQRYGADLRLEHIHMSPLTIPPSWNIVTGLRLQAGKQNYRLRLFYAEQDSAAIQSLFPPTPAHIQTRPIRIETGITLAPIILSVRDVNHLRPGDVLLLGAAPSEQILLRLSDLYWPALLEQDGQRYRLQRDIPTTGLSDVQGIVQPPSHPFPKDGHGLDNHPLDGHSPLAQHPIDGDSVGGNSVGGHPIDGDVSFLKLDPVLAQIDIAIDDLERFIAGSSLSLDTDPGQSVILFLDHQEMFRGSLVSIRNQRGILLSDRSFDPNIVPLIAAHVAGSTSTIRSEDKPV